MASKNHRKTSSALASHPSVEGVSNLKLKIKKIRGKGRGVIAQATVKSGEQIESAAYLEMSATETKTLWHTRLVSYIYDLGRGRSAIAFGFGSLFNHSNQPNAEYEIDARTRVIRYRALRAIRANEEITIDYGYDPTNSKTWTEDLRTYHGQHRRARLRTK